jgi:hypothetical protein
MGLDLSVGILVEAAIYDTDSLASFRTEFEHLSQALVEAGLQPHNEPEQLSKEQTFSCQMWGYSGLHYLRRVAAHEALGKALPGPGDSESSHDPVVEDYYARVCTPKRGWLRRLFNWSPMAGQLDFEHLMLHSDAEGYYVPQDFPHVIFPGADLKIAGDMIGSVPRLNRECMRLASWLGLPADLDPESQEVFEAAESPLDSGPKWKQFGVESFCCVRLLRACEVSLGSRAALVFC